ncbi:MAG TPA: HAD-IB family phosphatase [Candidatus Deferrimicrobium sp.]|nr:HAD-IB family phosphatase [Candidatus Deferrimicrobium sp.]
MELTQENRKVQFPDSKNQKKGIIFCDLEGTLTEEVSFWKNLNLEMGMTKEEDEFLYEEFMRDMSKYALWAQKIFLRWRDLNKTTLYKLNKEFFITFFKQHLKIKEGAKNFVQRCRLNYMVYVISGTPWEFCALAKEILQFNDYFSTTTFQFDENEQLKAIKGHEDGFYKDRIMLRIAKSLGYSRSQIIAIGDSENDFLMLNKAGRGILVGKSVKFTSLETILNSNVIRMENLDFEEVLRLIEEFIP